MADTQDELFAEGKPWSEAARRLVAEVDEALPDSADYATDRVNYLLAASNLVTQRQSFEAGWIGQRMSWLVISQSFLFSAFAAAATQHSIAVLVLLKWFVPIMGLIQATATNISIRAAAIIDGELYRTRSLLDVGLRRFAPGMKRLPPLGDVRLGKAHRTRRLGMLASQVIPMSLILVWIILLLALLCIHYHPLWVDRFTGIST